MKIFSPLAALIFALLLTLSFSCSKPGGPKAPAAPKYFLRSYFPTLHTGDWWRYRIVTDSPGVVPAQIGRDTITVTIVSSQAIGDSMIYRCTLTTLHNVVLPDTAYFSVHDSTIIFNQSYVYDMDFPIGTYKLQLPSKMGITWTFEAPNDALYQNSDSGSIKVLDKTYGEFEFYRNDNQNDAKDCTIWMSPGIGPVLESGYNTYGFYTIFLIDYHLN